jgi:hypothetical protein
VALGAETWAGGFGVVARAQVEGIGEDGGSRRMGLESQSDG